RRLRSYIDVIRSLRVLSDHVDGHVTRHAVELAPRLTGIARHQNAGGRCSHNNRFRFLGSGGNTSGARIEAAVRKFFPTLRRIRAAIETAVSSGKNRGFLSFGVNRMNQSVHGIGNDQIRASGRWPTALDNTERGERDRIEFTGNRQVSIALKLLHGGSRCWSGFTIRITEMITSGFERFLRLSDYLA